MTCPTAAAAIESAEIAAPEGAVLAVDVRLVMPFSGLTADAPAPDEILQELRDALQEEGLHAFLDLAYETNQDVQEVVGDLQLYVPAEG